MLNKKKFYFLFVISLSLLAGLLFGKFIMNTFFNI